MGCRDSGTDGEGRGGRQTGGRWNDRINKDLHSFGRGDAIFDRGFERQDGLVPAEEVINKAARLVECLSSLCCEDNLGVLVLVDVVEDDLTVVRGDVRHDKVLFESGWQNRISAIIDMLADDVHSTRGTAVKSGKDPVKVSEASLQVFIPGLVLLSD